MVPRFRAELSEPPACGTAIPLHLGTLWTACCIATNIRAGGGGAGGGAGVHVGVCGVGGDGGGGSGLVVVKIYQ